MRKKNNSADGDFTTANPRISSALGNLYSAIERHQAPHACSERAGRELDALVERAYEDWRRVYVEFGLAGHPVTLLARGQEELDEDDRLTFYAFWRDYRPQRVGVDVRLVNGHVEADWTPGSGRV